MPCHVISNGVDLDYFVPSRELPEPFSLVFTGMMAYMPNHEGITWFLDDVFPRVRRALPDARLYIVGKDPPASLRQRASAQVVVTGTVPDVRPWLRRATASIVPLRSGGGTRLKISEALAMKKPVVTTRIGCEGIDVVDGESVLIADGAASFADAVVRLLTDAELRARLGSSGHDLVCRRYGWSAIGEEVEALYERLLSRRTSAREASRPQGS